MAYVVLDLEWNQSPDGKEQSVERLPFEIIEIGAVKLDEALCQIDTFRRLIRPAVYKEIHFKISEVTHIDIGRLEAEGIGFPQAAAEFLEWCGGDATFCSWGPMDLMELQRNMDYYGMENPFPYPFFYYDVQKLYALLYGCGKERPSLDLAVETMGLSAGQPFHQALEDAAYTARVMAHLDFGSVKEYRSLDYYRLPRRKEEEIYLTFPNYSKYVSRVFPTREEAIADKGVTDMVCYACRRMLRKKVRWFTPNQKIYYALAYCPEHGYLKGKIRMKRSEDGMFYAVKTLKMVGPEGVDEITERRDEFRKRRNQKNRMRREKRGDEPGGHQHPSV